MIESSDSLYKIFFHESNFCSIEYVLFSLTSRQKNLLPNSSQTPLFNLLFGFYFILTTNRYKIILSGYMKINISNMESGLHEIQLSEPSHRLELLGHGHLVGKIDLKATIDRRDEDLNLKAEISSAAELLCDRCLSTFQYKITAKINLYFSNKLSKLEDDIKPLHLNNQMIDLSEEIRSAFVLTLPIKLLCTDNCKGLCPTCGANWNEAVCSCKSKYTDPRWDKLMKLQLST